MVKLISTFTTHCIHLTNPLTQLLHLYLSINLKLPCILQYIYIYYFTYLLLLFLFYNLIHIITRFLNIRFFVPFPILKFQFIFYSDLYLGEKSFFFFYEITLFNRSITYTLIRKFMDETLN